MSAPHQHKWMQRTRNLHHSALNASIVAKLSDTRRRVETSVIRETIERRRPNTEDRIRNIWEGGGGGERGIESVAGIKDVQHGKESLHNLIFDRGAILRWRI